MIEVGGRENCERKCAQVENIDLKETTSNLYLSFITSILRPLLPLLPQSCAQGLRSKTWLRQTLLGLSLLHQ